MEIPDELVSLYSAQVERRGDRYVVEVPESELTVGDVRPGGTYRVALLGAGGAADDGDDEPSDRPRDAHGAPVDVGERRTVEVEDIGEQGDGIARVERGYVVIVPDTEQGERVTVEITDVRENLGFAEVVERHAYYE